MLDELLAAERMNDRRLQRPGQGDELVVRAGAARPPRIVTARAEFSTPAASDSE